VIADFEMSSAKDVADFYRVSSQQHLRINMVVSLDGNFVGPSGKSRDLSGPLDLSVLLTLRLLSDVVLVGAKTAIGEKYRYTAVRDELKTIAAHNPPFCLVSSTLDIPSEAPIFSDSANLPTIITSAGTDSSWQQNYDRLSELAQIQVIDSPELSGSAIRSTLHSLGFNRIVCEGGPRLLQTLLASEVVSELDLTVSPTIVGTKPTRGALGDAMKRLKLDSIAKGEDFLFTRYLLGTEESAN
jgi:riboflavin biosynthesis pyrimidine reductase